MRKSRFTDAQIIGILIAGTRFADGVDVPEARPESSVTRDSLRLYLATNERPLHGWLFTGQGVRWSHSHLSESRLWRLLKGWLVRARLDPALYGLHSLRRTFQTCIHQQTCNLRAAQILPGHVSIESTKDYIGTEQAEALNIARKYHL